MRLFLSVFCCMAICSFAQAREHLYDNFDTYPAGSIANQPGWSRYQPLNTRTAQVSSLFSNTKSNALELTWSTNPASSVSAAYTNFTAVYQGTNNPIIRASAMLFLQSSNTFFQIGLRNTNSGAFLTFQNLNGYGSAGFTYRDNFYVPLETNRWRNITLYYNMSNRNYAVDYNYSNVLSWTDTDNEGTTAIYTQFQEFVITRMSNSIGSAGFMFVDDVRVETFPLHTWAWWRCDDTGGAFIEQLGLIQPTLRIGLPDAVRTPSSDPVYDGEYDFHNDSSMRQIIGGPSSCSKLTPRTTNWTLEAVFKTAPGEQNFQMLDWATDYGFNTSGCYLGFAYVPASSQFYYSLRDADGGTGTVYESTACGSLIPDSRWHHAALVKSNAVITLFVDYQAVNTNTLPASADGSYVFNALSKASIGRTLNNGNYCGENTQIDEIRFSGKALALEEFLQPGQPVIVEIQNGPWEDPWDLTIKGIMGRSYRVEASPSLGADASWTEVDDFTANYTFNFAHIPAGSNKFVRVIRE